jgi:putative toxin-antitoxin system antitoxin component (TIGR02293 family)
MKTPDIERRRIQERAEETFGSHEKAKLWLTRRTKALGNKAPMDLLDSDSGIQQVEDLLIRIDHGLGA